MLNKLENLYSINVSHLEKSVIRELLKLTQKPEIISFAGGLPSPETFPIAEIAELVRSVVLENGRWALQYGPTEGDPKLKEEIVKFMAADGVQTKPENMIITSASQQALDLIGKIFINRNNSVIVGRPSYIGALSAFKSYGAKFIGVDLDEQGIRIDLLQEKLHHMRLEGELPKFIYVVPDFQNPAGVTLTLDRRKTLLQLAREYQLLIVEDTPYRSLRYVGDSVPSLYQLDGGEGYVVSIFTFSKILSPGLRLGWMLADPKIIDKCIIAKQAMDLCTSSFNQAIVYEYCRLGLLNQHIQEIIALYKTKRSVMLEALRSYMPAHPDICWTKPDGGLFLWIQLPEKLDAEKMFFQAVRGQVAYVVGTGFYTDGSGRNAMRLNFSYPSENDIVEGVKRLAKVIAKKL